MKTIKELIQHADYAIEEILVKLDADMKDQGLRVTDVSIDRYEFKKLEQRVPDSSFKTWISIAVIEPRRK